jgi:beta-lactam-binding protein with PASTA domain
MRRFFRFVLLGLVLVLVALVSAFTVMRLAIHGREVEVPKLAGLTLQQAEEAVGARGLRVVSESRFYSAEVPEGRVISQVPPAGTRVRRGWKVRVAESLGPQRVSIPNVIGQSARAGEINVRRRGLEIGTVAVATIPGLAPDQVAAQSPPPEATGAASPKMSLLITAPQQATAYVMPNLVGNSLAGARQIVEGAGLRAVSPAGMPPGATVVRQTPAAGAKVLAGSTIFLETAAPEVAPPATESQPAASQPPAAPSPTTPQ